MQRTTLLIAGALVGGVLLASCGNGGGAASPASTAPPSVAPTAAPTTQPTAPGQSPVPAESPAPAENAPPGDIPDNTAYVPYHSTSGGLTISVPEGWARSTAKSSVLFTDKLNTIAVSWQPASAAPTVATAKATEVPQLMRTTRAFRLKSVSASSLPAGPVVLLEYQINSDPNPVTGKQYRLDVLRYELFNNGVEGVITLLSPVGADNVDPWRIVTQSFKWS